MYEYITGKLVVKNPTYVVVETNGIGYMVNISLNTFTKIKEREDIKLYIHFYVREDAQILYGFSDENERELFRYLLSSKKLLACILKILLRCGM